MNQELFENVAKEMATYEKLMAQAQFMSKSEFEAKYAFSEPHTLAAQFADPVPVTSWGDAYHKSKVYSPAVSKDVVPLDLERAKPFIRAVIERMLDLIGSEENWIKGQTHKNVNGVDAYCLIGAQAQALADLTLNQYQADPVVETQRKRVLAAIEQFLNDSLREQTGFNSMPSFNDDMGTEFEDVRLWLKGLLGQLDD